MPQVEGLADGGFAVVWQDARRAGEGSALDTRVQLFEADGARRGTGTGRSDSRMWCAMAGCYKQLGKKHEAIKCYQRAESNNDREGIALRWRKKTNPSERKFLGKLKR